MSIILIMIFLLILITVRPVKNNENYLEKKNTNTIKGIFILLVFCSHFISYSPEFSSGWIDQIGIKIIKKIGQLMVTLFLFYSGYGIMESIKKKGKDYIHSMPKKRVLATLLNFDFAVMIYIIASKYFVENSVFSLVSIKKIVLSFIGWDSFGNSNWYIFCILILYGIAYLSFQFFNNRKHALISTVIGTLLYTIIISFFKGDWWYNTAFCFPLGMIFSEYKEKIEDWMKDKELFIFIYLVMMFVISYYFSKHIVWYHFYTIIFTLLVVFCTRKFTIKNMALEWMGKNLFPMYIFQRLPMMILIENPFMRENTYIFFVVSFVITIMITFLYIGMMKEVSKLKRKTG